MLRWLRKGTNRRLRFDHTGLSETPFLMGKAYSKVHTGCNVIGNVEDKKCSVSCNVSLTSTLQGVEINIITSLHCKVLLRSPGSLAFM